MVLLAQGTPRRILTAGRTGSIPGTKTDLLFDAFSSGALGGSAVALFFLVCDFLDGQPLFTPSLMGSVIFHGVAAEDVAKVQLDAVAYYSLVHIAAFTAIGGAISLLVREVELQSRNPVVVLLVLFAIIEAAFFVVVPVALPSVIARLGMVRVGAANLLAAGAMALFFVLSQRVEARETLKHNLPDFIFDSFYSGAIGGSVVALFFLAVDSLGGQPLFTPALMGSVLFFGVAAEAVQTVHLEAVAYFSMVHFAASGALGTSITWLVHQVELRSRNPFVVLIVLFAIIEVGFLVVASLALPGVIVRLGIVRVGAANLLAAGAMSFFFVLSHRDGAWEKLKRAAHLA